MVRFRIPQRNSETLQNVPKKAILIKIIHILLGEIQYLIKTLHLIPKAAEPKLVSTYAPPELYNHD